MAKNKRKKWNLTGKIFFTAIISFAILDASVVLAQNSLGTTVSEMAGKISAGMPVEDMISAAKSGGLSGAENIEILKSQEDFAAEEVSFAGEDHPADSISPVLSADSLESLESQGGISSKPQPSESNSTIFDLATRFLKSVIFKSSVEFEKRPVFGDGMEISGVPVFDKDTAGYAVIKKGSQSVKVDFGKEYDEPPVVTATLSLQQYKDSEVMAAAEDLLLISDVKYIITDVTKKKFEIMMDRKADSDIPFSWHALAVDNPKTFKKAGESQSGSVAGDSDVAPYYPYSPSENEKNSGLSNNPQAVSGSAPSSEILPAGGDVLP